MQRRHRRWHLKIWLALALPLVLALVLAAAFVRHRAQITKAAPVQLGPPAGEAPR